MNFFAGINRLPWKYVIGMNLTVLALAVTFLSTASVKHTTENRSQAEETSQSTSPTPLPRVTIDSARPPRLISPDVSWGKVGDAVLVTGENLGTVPFGTLKLNNQPIPTNLYVDWAPNHIVFTIPADATTGFITLTATTTSNQEINLSTNTPLTITTKNQ